MFTLCGSRVFGARTGFLMNAAKSFFRVCWPLVPWGVVGAQCVTGTPLSSVAVAILSGVGSSPPFLE